MGRDDVRTIDVHRGASSCCADSTPRFSAVLGASRTHDRAVSPVFWEEAATRSPQRQDGPLGRYLSTPADEPWSPVLKAVKRDFSRGQPDHPRLLTGRGRYVDDITLPRMVHVAFVRSPHAHAAITRIDVSAAAKSPGVVGVLTGVEAARLCRPYRGILRHYHGMKTGAMTPLALERVRCVGKPGVAIAAETAAAAHDAAARGRVDYAPLPTVLDPA